MLIRISGNGSRKQNKEAGFMGRPYKYELRNDRNGRIIEKIETVGGKPVTWK